MLLSSPKRAQKLLLAAEQPSTGECWIPTQKDTPLPWAKDSLNKIVQFSQFNSAAQSCLTLCDPMNHSTPGLPVHHQLLESTQTHVH